MDNALANVDISPRLFGTLQVNGASNVQKALWYRTIHVLVNAGLSKMLFGIQRPGSVRNVEQIWSSKMENAFLFVKTMKFGINNIKHV